MTDMIDQNRAKTNVPRNFLAACGLLLGGLFVAANSQAGSFIFAGETLGTDVVTHPTGYDGTGGAITVNVCIKGNVNTTAMEQSVKNVIAVYNRLQPTTGNLQNGKIPFFEFDFESVALHEVGHCLGLAHPNLASESGLSGNDRNYTKTTDGANDGFDINAGADSVIGSSDDSRGDDVNLHWFRDGNNNPFSISTIVDFTTYSRDTANLPAGHAFAANADRTVGSDVLNTPGSETVMQQGTFNNEIQRTLVPDDVATLRYAMSGYDEQEGTADDYTFALNLNTAATDCDINIQFNNDQTGFAVCSVGASSPGNGHWTITSANVFFNDGTDPGNTFTWHFNTAAPCNENLALTQSQWTMISLPCDVGISTNNTVADVFGDDLTGTYDTDWVVYERDSANDVYTKLAANSTLKTGKGYWIITDQAGQTINVQGQYNSVPDFDLQVDADGRQNMVGHPLDISVDWVSTQFIDGADILTLAQADPDISGVRACEMTPPDPSCKVSRVMYKWNGAAYQAFDGETTGAEGVISQFDSIWVKSFRSGVQLRTPAAATAAAGSDVSAAVDSNDPSAALSRRNSRNTPRLRPFSPGYIRLIAESGDLVDPGNLLGYLPDSRNGYDKHDLKELPPFSDAYLTIVFPHKKWDGFSGDYTTDFRSPRGKRWARWHFAVHTSLPVGTEVRLRWEAPENVLKFARLIDVANGEKIKADKNGEYRFQVRNERHPFVWSMRRPTKKQIMRRSVR